jgi:hypothetical protein
LWLAYHDLNRLPGWVLASLPILVISLVRWPRALLLLVPLIIVLAILKPRFGSRPGGE